MDPILTSIQGNNDALMAQVMRLYAQPDDIVADVTYGNGVFWRLVDISKYDFRPTDIQTGVDCRELPYADYEIDIVVLDPPYMNRSSAMLREDLDGYRNNQRTEVGEKAVLDLYYAAMDEAYRVLAENGLLMVKCMDQVEAGHQCWGHIDIFNYATKVLLMEAADLFILTRVSAPIMRHKTQVHARKNHSYLWIFIKN